MPIRGVKTIIMDKAPNGNAITMGPELGYDQPAYQALVDAFNLEFGKNVTVADIDTFNTFGEVVTYLESV